MKYCVHCGKEVLDSSIVCPNCGCSVSYDEGRTAAAPQPAPAPVADSYSTMSILGLVFSFVGALIGLIISIIAYKDAKQTGSQKSMSMSKAGIIISSIELGIAALSVLIYIVIIIIAIATVGNVPVDPGYYSAFAI